MILSVGIVAYNEENHITNLLSDILDQTYDKGSTELLFINSLSTDSTRSIFEEFAEKYADKYYNIQVQDNFGGIQASGWNVAIDHFKGDALLRLDAHTKVTPTFFEKNVECIESGEDVCGGARPNLPCSQSAKHNLIYLADSSMFGGSFGKYHSSSDKQYVDTVFHGCYKREVIEKVGHFNESLGRTEDNDFHSRIRECGYKICYDPSILSYQYSRDSIIGSIKQKYGNGYWIGRTLKINSKCISLFHLVPFAFVVAIVICLVSLIFTPYLFLLLAVAYFLAALLLSVMGIWSNRIFRPLFLLLPIYFFVLHFSYGVGTLIGLFSSIKREEK